MPPSGRPSSWPARPSTRGPPASPTPCCAAWHAAARPRTGSTTWWPPGALPSLQADPVAHLAVSTSHPAWIVGGVHDALAASKPARTWDDTRAELLADNTAGAVTLVARTLDRSELARRMAEQGVSAHDGALSRLAVRVDAVNPATIPEVATGAAGVQDEGSQVVALALADAALDGPDGRWLDMCAGPGGKAALLAGQVVQRGGSLTAVELHAHRAELVRASLRPIQGRHEVLVADATVDDIGTGYDRVLLDAPCTGPGRPAPPARVAVAPLRRRPHRAHRAPAPPPGPCPRGGAPGRAWSSTSPARRTWPRPRPWSPPRIGSGVR